MSRLPPMPALDWSADGAPRATAFDDSYFSRDGGLAESDMVFLGGCGLPDAWANRDRFAVGELGFGTGLNALAVWRAWKKYSPPHAILHMCSIEAFPLEVPDAARALAAFPELAPLADKLLARWPVRAYAPQRLWFPEDRFALTVLIGEAASVLAGMQARFDAWFLDGFAPARNPAMWESGVFRRIAELSAPGARVASYSVAGDVRRGLEAAGFRVEKKPGFGAKRERLEAVLAQAAASTHPLYPSAPSNPRRVAIIGGGIAGAATAAALTRRNVETIVLEEALMLGAGASGNPAGLVAPRLDRDQSGISEVFLAAYLDAVATYCALGPDVFAACGLEERSGAREEAVIAALLADPPLPPEWLRRVSDGALYPQAGVLRPEAAIRALLRDATLMCEAPVAAIESAGEGWRLIAPDGKAQLKADAVVLACGSALASFEPAGFLPLQFSRGQIEWGLLTGAPPAHAELGPCFAAPHDGGLLFGATFDRVELTESVEADAGSRARNIAALRRLNPDLAARLNLDALNSRAALRVSTPDRAPIVGLMPDASAWLSQNAGITHGRPPPDLPAPALHGVYVIGALGARGFTLAPLLGEAIAASMFGEPKALSARAFGAIHPARFLHRALKKAATMRETKRDKDNGI